MVDYDVIIVGSGAAGLSAAVTASEAGARVLVIEGADATGGSSRLSGGQLMAANTSLQRDLGFEDSAESLFRDYMALNQWTVEPPLARRLADESGSAVDWLMELGVPFHRDLRLSSVESVPRDHYPVTNGDGIVTTLEQVAKRNGADIALGKRVDRLLVEGGRVVGVSAGGDNVTGRAVILATGGFGANPDLLKQYFPSATAAGDWLWHFGAETSQGDAFALAEQVNAQIIGHDRGLLLPSPNFGPGLDVFLPGWLVVVNERGHRFFDETSPYSTTQAAIRAQGGPVFAVFDQASKQTAQRATAPEAKKQQFPGNENEFMQFKWIEPIIDEMVEKGVIRTADTLDDLALQLGIPPRNLTGTAGRYNQDVAEGTDTFYGKPMNLARPIATPPFYGTELRLALLGITFTGPRIDADARVIGFDAFPIPGLYAAGECVGGVLGDIYVGSGNSYTNCVVFGRVAGRTAAADARAAQIS